MKPDKALIELGAQLDKAWRAERQAIASNAPDRQVEATYRRCGAIVQKIKRARASSIAGLRVKARAVAWCHSGRTRRNLFRGSTTDLQVAGSIVSDLLAM
jgi:hypothetical protein